MADKKKKSPENQVVSPEIVNEEQPKAKSSLSESQLRDKDKYAYIIKRKRVRQKARRKTVSLVMIIFVLVALLITGLVYGVLTFIDFNSFRISVERTNLNYLSLSEDYEFTNPSSVLSLSGPKNMDNWTYDWLPITKLLNEEGSLSGDNYIACAFYLQNIGEESVFYSENITLTNVYKGLEDTIRILLIKQIVSEDESGNVIYSDPEYRCYAKVSGDDLTPEYVAGGNGDEKIPVPVSDPNNINSSSPWYTIPFYAANSGVVLDAVYYPLKAGEKIRYAMAVWIEGTDPECTDDKLGGKVSYTFQFNLETDEQGKVVIAEE
jgi:archaellum component FlaG (FlaF/FlaG flagellin family)